MSITVDGPVPRGHRGCSFRLIDPKPASKLEIASAVACLGAVFYEGATGMRLDTGAVARDCARGRRGATTGRLCVRTLADQLFAPDSATPTWILADRAARLAAMSIAAWPPVVGLQRPRRVILVDGLHRLWLASQSGVRWLPAVVIGKRLSASSARRLPISQ